MEQRFETLFEQAPFSLQLLARDGRTLRVNRAWERLWQVRDGDGVKEYVLGEYNILHDPQLEATGVAAALRRAFAGESVELPTIHYDPAKLGKAGRARWVRAFAHPVLAPDGTLREVMLIHEDVTDRREAETALRDSEMRLKQLANTIPQLAWMAEPSGHIHWYNDRWYEYTGTTPEQMMGWGWQAVHDPATLPEVLARWKASLASGEPFRMTFPLRGRDGRFRPFLTLVAPLKDEAGRVAQWFGTNTDVSALAEAQEGLRKAQERLRLALLAGNIGIWEWDVDRDVVRWTDEVYALHGMAPGEFGGTAGDFVARVHPADRDALWHRIQAGLARGEGFAADFRIQLPAGGTRWLSTWAQLADGGSAGRTMIGATLSIDAYKTAEAALREADRRKDEFLAMLAHELRNPLAPISAAAHLLRMGLGDPAKVQRAAEVIGRQVAHVTRLVDDLLDVSRVTRGLIRLERELVDLAEVVEAAIEQSAPLLEARTHRLERSCMPAVVRGDRSRLVQVLVNLLNNAARYTPPGGRIEVALECEAGAAVLTVRDTGAGIEAQVLPRVFDLFYRGEGALDPASAGLGVGLALARRLVELHGGSIEAASPGRGAGSTFTVRLPLESALRARPTFDRGS